MIGLFKYIKGLQHKKTKYLYGPKTNNYHYTDVTDKGFNCLIKNELYKDGKTKL